jgi:hypothetical protein
LSISLTKDYPLHLQSTFWVGKPPVAAAPALPTITALLGHQHCKGSEDSRDFGENDQNVEAEKLGSAMAVLPVLELVAIGVQQQNGHSITHGDGDLSMEHYSQQLDFV